MGRAALNPLPRRGAAGRVRDDLSPQRRDVLAAALGGRGRRAARRRILAPERLAAFLLATAPASIGRALATRPFAPSPLLAAPVVRARLLLRLLRRRAPLDQRRIEIDAGFPGELRAQLVAQHPGAHFRHLALGEIAEFERAEGNADQAIDRQPQVFQHLLDLAVLAFAQAHRDPGVGALLPVELGFDRRVVDAVEADPAAQAVEPRLVDRPVRAHAIAAEPPGRGQFEHPREAAVIGQ